MTDDPADAGENQAHVAEAGHPPLTEREVLLVKMALAEAGYPDAVVDISVHPRNGVDTVSVDWTVPRDVCWRAYTLIDAWGALPCFTCWDAAQRTREKSDCPTRGLAVLNCGTTERADALASRGQSGRTEDKPDAK